ncbi:MAG TPA: FliH/SctL family protein [Bryobacteraceae bacterium]|nr:FliH/SctL family protein [Bryobacteraceae bacterium]
MLSKVLSDAKIDARPMVWRQGAKPAKPVPPPPSATPLDEPSQLRGEIRQLHSQMEQKAREAFEAGIRAGETAAKERLEQELRATIGKLADAIADIASLRDETIHRAEADTVRLAVEIARRILHRELTLDTTALGALIRAALEKLQAQEVYRVRVHPDHADIVRSCLDETRRSQTIEIVPDASQPQGGAVFEISRGALDASVDTQLREIESGLADRLEARI